MKLLAALLLVAQDSDPALVGDILVLPGVSEGSRIVNDRGEPLPFVLADGTAVVEAGLEAHVVVVDRGDRRKSIALASARRSAAGTLEEARVAGDEVRNEGDQPLLAIVVVRDRDRRRVTEAVWIGPGAGFRFRRDRTLLVVRVTGRPEFREVLPPSAPEAAEGDGVYSLFDRPDDGRPFAFSLGPMAHLLNGWRFQDEVKRGTDPMTGIEGTLEYIDFDLRLQPGVRGRLSWGPVHLAGEFSAGRYRAEAVEREFEGGFLLGARNVDLEGDATTWGLEAGATLVGFRAGGFRIEAGAAVRFGWIRLAPDSFDPDVTQIPGLDERVTIFSVSGRLFLAAEHALDRFFVRLEGTLGVPLGGDVDAFRGTEAEATIGVGVRF